MARRAPLSTGFPTDENSGAGCHFPLQGILPTLGSNPRLLHCRGLFTAGPPGQPRVFNARDLHTLKQQTVYYSCEIVFDVFNHNKEIQ